MSRDRKNENAKMHSHVGDRGVARTCVQASAWRRRRGGHGAVRRGPCAGVPLPSLQHPSQRPRPPFPLPTRRPARRHGRTPCLRTSRRVVSIQRASRRAATRCGSSGRIRARSHMIDAKKCMLAHKRVVLVRATLWEGAMAANDRVARRSGRAPDARRSERSRRHGRRGATRTPRTNAPSTAQSFASHEGAHLAAKVGHRRFRMISRVVKFRCIFDGRNA